MEDESLDPLLDEIHEICRRISVRYGNDPARLVQHYREYEEELKERLDANRGADWPKRDKPAA